MKAPRASICALKGSVTVVPIGTAVCAQHSEHARSEPRSGSPRASGSLVGGAVLSLGGAVLLVGLAPLGSLALLVGVASPGEQRRGRAQHVLGELALAGQQLLGELVGVPGQLLRLGQPAGE